MNPLDTVNEFIRLIEANDMAAAGALLADDCEYDNVPMGKVFGRQAVEQGLGPFLASASAVEWKVFRQAATDHVVFNERLDRFQFGDKWMEIPVTGVWEVHDGRITLWRDYFDLATYANQK
jgi:limonene-1,2-epoxide hydrolase